MNNINKLKPHQACGVFFENRFLKEFQKRWPWRASSSKDTEYEYWTDIILHPDKGFGEETAAYSFYEIKSHKAFHSHSSTDIISKIMKSGIDRAVKSENHQGLLHQLTITSTVYPDVPTFAVIGCYNKESNQLYNDWLRDEDKAWASYTKYILIRCTNGVWETFVISPDKFWDNNHFLGFNHWAPLWSDAALMSRHESLIEFIESLSVPVNIEAYEEFIEVLGRQRRGATWRNEPKSHRWNVEDQPGLDLEADVEPNEMDGMKRKNKRKPTKAKAAIKTEILESLRAGMTIKAATILANISEKTFYNWRDTDEVFLEQYEEAARFAEAEELDDMEKYNLPSLIAGADMTLKDFKKIQEVLEQGGSLSEASDAIKKSSGYLHGILHHRLDNKGKYTEFKTWINSMLVIPETESEDDMITARQNDLILSQQAELSQLKEEVARQNDLILSQQAELSQLKEEVEAPSTDQALEDIYKTQLKARAKELEDMYRAKIDKQEKELDTWAELVDDLHERLDRHHKLIDHFLG